MNNREIVIACTASQKRFKLNTAASTLAELKTELDAQGVTYAGMTFTEILTNTQLMADNSIIPEFVTMNGENKSPIIVLTNTRKKIESGASRSELYDAIKDNNLQQACIDNFGKNFTQCSSSQLQELLDSVEFIDEDDSCDKEEVPVAESVTLAEAYCANIECYYKQGDLNSDELVDIAACCINLLKKGKVTEENTLDEDTNSLIDKYLQGK